MIHLKRFHSDSHGYTKLQFNVEFPLTDFDIARYTVGETPNVGWADLKYWEQLGGQYNATQKENTPVDRMEKSEKKWEAFEAEHRELVWVGRRVECRRFRASGAPVRSTISTE